VPTFLIQVVILQVYNDFVEEVHFDTIGVTNVVSIGGIGVVFDNVVRSSPIPWVHDYSIVVAFGGPIFDILPSVPSSSCSVIVGSADQDTIVNQIPNASSVGSMDRKKNVVQLTNFGISRSGGSKFVMDSKDSFWNNMFEKELPKYKGWLDTLFPCHPLETINVNIAFGHVFNHLQNCPISITYVVDLKSLPSLRNKV
jgi:hypothetical protein